jgi:hypothetical protein
MMLDWPTFVLQRRINRPLAAIEDVLCDPHRLRAGTVLDLDGDGTDGMYTVLDGPFGVTFPPFGLDGASWWAPASAHTRRGRTLVRFEIEINAWDTDSTELLIRPRARHPYRWGGHRLREYFRVAHSTADELTRLLASESVTLRTCSDSSTSTDAPRSRTRARGTTSPSSPVMRASRTHSRR